MTQGTYIDGSETPVNHILIIEDKGIGVMNLHANGCSDPVLLNLTKNQINQLLEAAGEK